MQHLFDHVPLLLLELIFEAIIPITDILFDNEFKASTYTLLTMPNPIRTTPYFLEAFKVFYYSKFFQFHRQIYVFFHYQMKLQFFDFFLKILDKAVVQ